MAIPTGTGPRTPRGGIVVGVDGSPGSLAALRWAIREASTRGRAVHAVTATRSVTSCCGGRSRQGISARVVDMRWLAPLPVEDIRREAYATGRVLVVDETRRSGGMSEGVVTALVDDGFTGPIRRVASEDSFIPLGDAGLTVLLSEDTVEAAAVKLVHQ